MEKSSFLSSLEFSCQVLSAITQTSLLPDSFIPFIFPHRLFLVLAPPVWSYPCCPGPLPGFLHPSEAVGVL